MPTSKPRITLTLTEQQHAVLEQMSDLGGGSMSSIVVELLDTALPMLERVVVAMQAATQASEDVKKGLAKSFSEAERDLLPQLAKMMGQLDLLLEPVPASGSALAETRAGTGKSRKRQGPPSTNRGVRIPPTDRRKANTGAASSGVRKGSKK